MRLHFEPNVQTSTELNSTAIEVVSATLRAFKSEEVALNPGQSSTMSDQVINAVYRHASGSGLTVSLYKFLRPLLPNRRGESREQRERS